MADSNNTSIPTITHQRARVFNRRIINYSLRTSADDTSRFDWKFQSGKGIEEKLSQL